MRPLQRSADTEEFTFRLDTLRYRHCVLISVRPGTVRRRRLPSAAYSGHDLT
jgi:hypothetical protein